MRACGLVKLSRTAWYRRPQARTERDHDVIEALNGTVEQKPRWGFWKCFDRLRLDGRSWNHKRVHRVYCALRLNLPRRTKRRVPMRLRQRLAASARLNDRALDFLADALYGWRPFRTLNVIDEGNREALGIEVATTSIPARRVIRVMEQLIELYGEPRAIRLDNGRELTSSAFTEWCEAQRIALPFIQPGKPDQNAFIERFNRTYRDEVLDAYVVRLDRSGSRSDCALATGIQRRATTRQPRACASADVRAEAKTAGTVQRSAVSLTVELTHAHHDANYCPVARLSR